MTELDPYLSTITFSEDPDEIAFASTNIVYSRVNMRKFLEDPRKHLSLGLASYTRVVGTTVRLFIYNNMFDTSLYKAMRVPNLPNATAWLFIVKANYPQLVELFGQFDARFEYIAVFYTAVTGTMFFGLGVRDCDNEPISRLVTVEVSVLLRYHKYLSESLTDMLRTTSEAIRSDMKRHGEEPCVYNWRRITHAFFTWDFQRERILQLMLWATSICGRPPTPYVVLWILDWFPASSLVSTVERIRYIESVHRSICRILAASEAVLRLKQ